MAKTKTAQAVAKTANSTKVSQVVKAESRSSAVSAEGGRTAEAKLARLLRLPSESEADKVLTQLKSHGLNRTQVVALVENIRREESAIIYGEKVIKGELQTHQEDLMDEADLASSDIEQGMKMRMANRENFKVKRLHRALDKVRDGSYGECEGCGSDIGYARLSARSIAELCIACKEDEERKENLSAVGRKPKSLGQVLGNRLSVN